MGIAALPIGKDTLAAFCRRSGIRRLSLFGSLLHGGSGPGSDVDLLVEFEPGATVGLLRLAELESELSRMIGRKVDLRTPAELSRYFRAEVVAEAQVQYAA
jgi:predicted nucleotidyltransferase